MTERKAMAAARSNTNWFAVWVSIAVVVILVALTAVVLVLNNQATDAGPAPKGEIINSETGAISFGKGDQVIDTYVDFMCPACGAFEQTFAERLQGLASSDKITLNIHPVAILDRLSNGTNYSSRAAAAMYCVAEKAPERALDYFNLLYANQPQEQSAGLADEELSAYAEQAGAGAATDCINGKSYEKYGAAQAKAHDVRSTPSVDLNGDRLTGTVQEIYASVEKFVAAAS